MLNKCLEQGNFSLTCMYHVFTLMPVRIPRQWVCLPVSILGDPNLSVCSFVFLAPSWPAAPWLGEGPQPPMDSSKQIRFPFWPRSFSTQWSHRVESNSFDSLLGEFHFWKLVHSLHPSLKGKDQRTQKVEGSNLILPGGLTDPSLWFLVPGSDASSSCGHRDAAQPDICWMPQAPGVRVV